MLKPNQKYLIFLSLALLSSPLVARELTGSHIKLNPSPNSKHSDEIFRGASGVETAPEGDIYTQAPQVQDSEFTFCLGIGRNE